MRRWFFPGSPDVLHGVALAARIAEAGRINNTALGQSGLQADRLSRARLAKWFDSIVDDVRAQLGLAGLGSEG